MVTQRLPGSATAKVHFAPMSDWRAWRQSGPLLGHPIGTRPHQELRGRVRLLRDHMKPGLRGRYWAQLPNTRDDISNMGSLIRIPCSIAILRAASLTPGRNADTCDEPLSAAKCSAVLKAGATAGGFMTASGPICPPAST